MKTTPFTPTVCLGLAALTAAAAAWAQTDAPAPTPAPASRNAPARGGANLRFNFRGAPLETVVTYMSEEAGYLITIETPLRGTVDAFSAQPVTREEALQLFNSALNKNGYTSVVQGRMITIVSKEDAKKKNLPIRTSNNPDDIPNTAEMYIQIIPLRRLDATTAARDLGTMLPGTATITPNAESNSLMVTDTNINLKQIVALVSALDSSSDTVSATKIFELKHADPFEMATLINSLYGTTAQAGRGGQNGQAAGGLAAILGGGGFGGAVGGFGGGGGGRGGGGFGGAGGGGRGGRGGTTVRTVPVTAVADPRTLRVIVTAAKEQMPDITELISQLDTASGRKQEAFTYTMENANVKQVETILKNLFPSSNTRTTTNNQADPLTTRATTNAQQNTTQNLQLGTTTPTTRNN